MLGCRAGAPSDGAPWSEARGGRAACGFGLLRALFNLEGPFILVSRSEPGGGGKGWSSSSPEEGPLKGGAKGEEARTL